MTSPEVVPAEAIRVLETFLDASRRGDEDGMRACLSRSTLESGQFSGKGPEGVEFALGTARREGPNVVVPVSWVATEGDSPELPFSEMPCVIVPEDGGWRLDLGQTMERLFGEGGLGRMVDELASTMQQAMEGVGEAIREGFESAFGPGAQETTEPPPEPTDPAAER